MVLTESEHAAAVAFDTLHEELPDLKLLVAQLHRCREDYRAVDAEYAAALDAFEAAHRDLLDRRMALARAETTADASLRAAALLHYAAFPATHPGPGLSIRSSSKPIYDEEEVKSWCELNLPIALERVTRLNRAVFEAVIAPLNLTQYVFFDDPLVRVQVTRSVAIDRDLDKSLLGEVAS